jgi:hypothetical protein
VCVVCVCVCVRVCVCVFTLTLTVILRTIDATDFAAASASATSSPGVSILAGEGHSELAVIILPNDPVGTAQTDGCPTVWHAVTPNLRSESARPDTRKMPQMC